MHKILRAVVFLMFFSFLGEQPLWASTTTPLTSHNPYTVGKGDLETDISFNADIFRGDADAENVSFTLGANYFLTDIFAPGAEFEFEHDGGNSARFFPNLKAYWPLHKRVLPYVQLGFGYAHIPGDDGFDFGIGPGINYLLSNTVALGIQFRYDLFAGDATVHELQFPLNFSIYFKL